MPHLRRRACRRRSDDRLSRQLRQETGRIGMAGSKQTDRLMKFSSPLGKDVLLIESLEGAEGISRLFEYHAELLAAAGTVIDPKSIVGSKVTIGIALSDVKGSRWIKGIVPPLAHLVPGADRALRVAHDIEFRLPRLSRQDCPGYCQEDHRQRLRIVLVGSDERRLRKA